MYKYKTCVFGVKHLLCLYILQGMFAYLDQLCKTVLLICTWCACRKVIESEVLLLCLGKLRVCTILLHVSCLKVQVMKFFCALEHVQTVEEVLTVFHDDIFAL